MRYSSSWRQATQDIGHHSSKAHVCVVGNAQLPCGRDVVGAQAADNKGGVHGAATNLQWLDCIFHRSLHSHVVKSGLEGLKVLSSPLERWAWFSGTLSL